MNGPSETTTTTTDEERNNNETKNTDDDDNKNKWITRVVAAPHCHRVEYQSSTTSPTTTAASTPGASPLAVVASFSSVAAAVPHNNNNNNNGEDSTVREATARSHHDDDPPNLGAAGEVVVVSSSAAASSPRNNGRNHNHQQRPHDHDSHPPWWWRRNQSNHPSGRRSNHDEMPSGDGGSGSMHRHRYQQRYQPGLGPILPDHSLSAAFLPEEEAPNHTIPKENVAAVVVAQPPGFRIEYSENPKHDVDADDPDGWHVLTISVPSRILRGGGGGCSYYGLSSSMMLYLLVWFFCLQSFATALGSSLLLFPLTWFPIVSIVVIVAFLINETRIRVTMFHPPPDDNRRPVDPNIPTTEDYHGFRNVLAGIIEVDTYPLKLWNSTIVPIPRCAGGVVGIGCCEQQRTIPSSSSSNISHHGRRRNNISYDVHVWVRTVVGPEGAVAEVEQIPFLTELSHVEHALFIQQQIEVFLRIQRQRRGGGTTSHADAATAGGFEITFS